VRGGFFPNCPIQNAQSRSLARIGDENIGHATVLCMDAAEPSRINPHLLAGAFRAEITKRWRWSLSRRSQKGGLTWARMLKLADDWLPKPRILHPWPNQRFAVRHPR